MKNVNGPGLSLKQFLYCEIYLNMTQNFVGNLVQYFKFTTLDGTTFAVIRVEAQDQGYQQATGVAGTLSRFLACWSMTHSPHCFA